MVGRNDPCPCGSGRKYKKCCLAHEESARGNAPPLREFEHQPQSKDPELAHWKEEDRRLIRAGMARIEAAPMDARKLIGKYWGRETLDGLRKEGLSGAAIHQFNQWFWLDWRRTPNGNTFAEQMMTNASLTEPQRRLLASMNSSHMSVYQVVRLDRGRGVELENVLEGGRTFVHDLKFSLSIEKWGLLFCRIYPAGPYNFMAAGGFAFPPRVKEFIRDYLDRELRKHRRQFPDVSLGEFLKTKAEVFGYLTAALHRHMAQLPLLQNADRDTLVFCKAQFAVASPEGMLTELRKCPALEEEGERKGQYKFVWLRPGKHQTRLLGHIALEGKKLVMECNSRERLAQGTKLLQEIGRLELVETEMQDARQLLEKGMKDRDTVSVPSEDESIEDLSEVQASLKQFLERHYEDWTDQPLPALAGQTPRQATKTASGRQKIIDLLHEMEYGDRGRAAYRRYDWNKLRRRLSLPEE